jgi:hypothetical protein
MNKEGPNVLWEITCAPEDDKGFHSGANVKILSQFPEEEEQLFPPRTMLTVTVVHDSEGNKEGDQEAGKEGANAQARRRPTKTQIASGEEIEFLRLQVTATFV